MDRFSSAAFFGKAIGEKAAAAYEHPISKSILTGAAIGMPVYGAIGALKGIFSPRTEYQYFTDRSGNRILDVYGNPIVKKKMSQPRWKEGLKFGLRGALSGAAVGGALGGLDHFARAKADTSSFPNNFTKKDISNIEQRLANEALKKFKFPKNTRAEVSLRDVASPNYKDAPGGFDAAVEAAQKHQDAAAKAGLIPWKKRHVDDPVLVTNKPEDWDRGTRISGFSDDNLKGYSKIMGGPIPYLPRKGAVRVNPQLDEQRAFGTLNHEVSHATLGDNNRTELPNLLKDVNFPNRHSYPENYIEYAGKPEEFKAHLANLKRDYVKQYGRQVDTEEEALKALKHYIGPRFPEKGDVLRYITPDLMKNEDIKKKMILQLLSIVKGKDIRNNSIGVA